LWCFPLEFVFILHKSSLKYHVSYTLKHFVEHLTFLIKSLYFSLGNHLKLWQILVHHLIPAIMTIIILSSSGCFLDIVVSTKCYFSIIGLFHMISIFLRILQNFLIFLGLGGSDIS
jgi:hypothetical protein